MYYGVYAPWDHAPKFLRIPEVMAPLIPVQYFFDANDVEGHEEKLKTWLHYVVNDGFYNDQRFGPGTLVYDYELNVRLLEALHLLLLDQEDFGKPRVAEEQLDLEKQEWDWFPVILTEKELLDPYMVIKAAFDEVKPQAFRDYLADWLGAALCLDAIDETVTPGEIIRVYEHLKKMYSAAWMIFQRDTDRTQYNDKTKKAKAIQHVGEKQADPEEGELTDTETETNDHISR